MNDDLVYRQDVQKLICCLNGCVGSIRNFENCDKRCPDFMAVDVLLSVKTNDDLISRKEAIALAYYHGERSTQDNPFPDGTQAVDIADLESLPSVHLEQRIGEFIFEKGDGETCIDGWVCTSCKKEFHTHVPYFDEFKYCPNCGAKMRKSVE